MTNRFALYPSLKDKAVFISGGATGIGAAFVTHFAEQGARVGFIDLLDQEAQALASEIAGKGQPKPLYRHCDVTDTAALKAAIAALAAELGPITVLINSAANDQRHTIEEVTPEYWDNRLAINIRHQFFAAQAIAPMMIAAGGGSIVNIGSASWHLGQGGMPAYVAAKAGIEGLTRGLARDLGPHKIRVNCIIPGWIMTERQMTLWLTPEAERGLMEKQCLKEKVYPADIARMALWLAADDSRLCSAQNWVVDGGWS
ncbi:MAG: SDR family oxidoreductase [Acidibrevibacterium sp.]|jgi:NAD(P)-dependent dehydrogenase (short-subunit alcohol dehydrogenase family)|uniref:SDR family NAD(P)-dependent oxidoreductase n=1 Tax=Acidibrevibacterium fodinaquatile TaxID=1969806 RepID=UPI000E0CE178|nr:SDR family oxidoreductase [Acidibrevibacterium fodinaquatile]MCA7119098.1 SDR family oxidoreductase [Acidibrevibacterium fodinaquatile]